MGNYIESNLARDEKIIKKANVSWLSQFWYLLFGFLFLLMGMPTKNNVFLLVGVVLIVIAIINVITTELAITNRRIIAKTGLIRRNTIELKVNRVESLGVNQSILGRIFNFGSIVVKGVGGSNAPIPFISNPLEFRQQVNNYLDSIDD
ncbi:PH domain-containing protein [Acinetobacter junii]|uniref:PH domain-containing protein n=1 Tax=Acinetobacter junii TaxID=40215 RepID=UPI001902227C|nr:PH domain-containing protein [Acinetobacter junii]MBJ8441014.1 PH domain-containing protein [Acinetobacter junii]